MISRHSTRWAVFILGAYMLVLSTSAVCLGAELPAQQLRTWTDATGKHTMQAELVDFNDGTVRLRKLGGEEITLPVEKLSDADRQFVQQQPKPESAVRPAGPRPATQRPRWPSIRPSRAQPPSTGMQLRKTFSPLRTEYYLRRTAR